MATIYLDVEAGETIEVGLARIKVEKRSGRRVRLKIEADKDVPVIKQARSGR